MNHTQISYRKDKNTIKYTPVPVVLYKISYSEDENKKYKANHSNRKFHIYLIAKMKTYQNLVL